MLTILTVAAMTLAVLLIVALMGFAIYACGHDPFAWLWIGPDFFAVCLKGIGLCLLAIVQVIGEASQS